MEYSPKYESDLLRGTEQSRPWDIIEEIRKYTRRDDILLDIGCGTATKLVKLGHDVKKIFGLEPGPTMRERAKENVRKNGLKNVVFVNGSAESIPFPDNSFDVVTCMLAPHDTYEVHRVLKPGRYAIIEKIGDRDKWNLKELFGEDEIGCRGQLAHLKEGQRVAIYQEQFGRIFSEVSINIGTWKTYYSPEDLVMLLEHTPMIRGFDRQKDVEILKKIQERHMTEKGIETQQNRLLICARK